MRFGGRLDGQAGSFAAVEKVLIVIIAAACLGLLLVNVLFRVRVLRSYKRLVQARVEFDAREMLTAERVEAIVARHPTHERDIRAFTGGIRRSLSIATLLIVMITALGATLMWYR